MEKYNLMKEFQKLEEQVARVVEMNKFKDDEFIDEFDELQWDMESFGLMLYDFLNDNTESIHYGGM